MFPTRTAVDLATASDLDKIIDKPHNFRIGLGIYQRLALVSDQDTCMRAIMPYISTKLSDQHKQVLRLIYDMAKSDTLGIAVEALLDTAEHSKTYRDKIAAATVINELYGEKHLIEDVKLTDKLMINLVDGNS